MKEYQEIKTGDRASVSKTLTEADVYGFAGICGDFNPVHVDETAAARTPFGRRICHGMLSASFISTVLGMYLPGPGSIYLEQNVKFVAPVYIGDTVTACATVSRVEGDIVTLDTAVYNQDQKAVITGSARVLVRKDPEYRTGSGK